MKKILFLALLVLSSIGLPAQALTLQNNAQCVGGTLVTEYSDVQDTGQNISSKQLAEADCSWLMSAPGQCCSVTYRRTTPAPPAIGSHVFSYSIFNGATIAPKDSTSSSPSNVPLPVTISFQYWAGINGAGSNTTPTPTTPASSAVTASLVANPNSIDAGESSLLTWSSTGATSCSGNFPTGGATSGSVAVSPDATTVYTVTCTNGTSGSSASCLADGEEVPAGHINNDGAFMTTMPWGECCSGQARVWQPAPNEPTEAVCFSRTQGSGVGTASGQVPITHNATDAYNSASVQQDISASGVAFPVLGGSTGFASDQPTMNRVCELIDGPGATATSIGKRGYDSPGNNSLVRFSGGVWTKISAKTFNSHLDKTFTCSKPGVSAVPSPSGQSATASATVLVSDGTFQVSCRAHPTRAGVGEDVLWSSTVGGPQGTYAYSWSGTDGLSGSSNDVLKKYSLPGRKSARLTVSYTPPSTLAAPPVPEAQPPAASGGYIFVASGAPYFTKICSGGTNTTNIQKPTCAGYPNFPSCLPSEAGEICKVHPYDDGGCATAGSGAIIQETGEPMPGPTLYGSVQNYKCSPPGTSATPTPVPTVPPSAAVCPQIGWVTPVTPCSGTWVAAHDQNGCQSGWQCVAGGSTGGGGGNDLLRETNEFNFINSLVNARFLGALFPGFLDLLGIGGGSALTPAATGNIVQHTEGELFTAAPAVKADMLANGGVAFTETTFVGRTLASDQVTMDRVCSVLHGTGSTAINIGSRGYNSCGNNGIIKFSGSTWASVSGCAGAHLSGSFSCVVPQAPPSAGTCALTITPASITAGQSATLSWTSTGISSITIDHGIGTVSGASGSRTITPTASGSYTATGVSGSTSTNLTPVSHTEGELFTSAPTVKQDMLTNGGVAFTETTFVGRTLASDQVTMDRVCFVLHGQGSTATEIGARGYNSCKNNGIIRFSAGKWESVSGCAGAHLSGSFKCLAPQTVSAPSIQCAAAVVTVTPGSQCRIVTTTQNAKCTGGSQIGTVTYTEYPDECNAFCSASNAACCTHLTETFTQTTNPGEPTTVHTCTAWSGTGTAAQQATFSNVPVGPNVPPRFQGTYRSSSTATQLSCGNGPQPLSKTVDCENTVQVGAAECSDNIDNDHDGLVDADDPSCITGDDDDGNSGDGVYDPNGSESGDDNTGAAQCSDGIDNNRDGNVDWPDDPGCSSADDNLELAEASEINLSVNPPLIKKDQQCTITLSAKNVATCSLTGSGISRTFTPVRGVISTSEVVTPALTQTSTYTLSCRGLDGKTATKKVDCKIAPTFEEI